MHSLNLTCWCGRCSRCLCFLKIYQLFKQFQVFSFRSLCLLFSPVRSPNVLLFSLLGHSTQDYILLRLKFLATSSWCMLVSKIERPSLSFQYSLVNEHIPSPFFLWETKILSIHTTRLAFAVPHAFSEFLWFSSSISIQFFTSKNQTCEQHSKSSTTSIICFLLVSDHSLAVKDCISSIYWSHTDSLQWDIRSDNPSHIRDRKLSHSKMNSLACNQSIQ